jgi:Diacylglycerol kinase catalytic domain
MPLLVVYNPVCGDGSARAFFHAHVLPLLEKHGKFIDKLACTERIGHAGDIALDFLKSTEGRITIVLGSGDGTLQEIVDVISSHGSRSSPREIQFVLVPCGTANALYSTFFHASDPNKPNDVEYKLRSVRAFIGDAKTIPLNIAITTLSSPPHSPKVPVVITSVVVVSTSLHAAILHDSENLRAEMPGLDRFKVAAYRNASNWYNGSVKLHPATSAGVVQVYSPSLKNFVTYGSSTETIPIVTLEGPFIYFLSTGLKPRIILKGFY